MATSSTDTTMRPAQIDFALRSVAAPRYKMMRIPLNNLPSASAVIGNTSSVTLEWKLPSIVYNLARSYISYNVEVSGQANTFYACTFEDVFDLGNAVTFGSAGGVDLVNLQYAQNYTKIARKIATPLEDLLGNDDMSGLYRSNVGGGLNVVPGGFNRVGGITYPSPDNYIDNKNMASGVVGTGNLGIVGTLQRYRQYPLSAFTGTLLGVDRDFYSPVEQYLRVSAGIGDKMAFTTTDAAANPSTGAASIVALGTGLGVSINSVYLYLCVEKNMDIVESMMARYAAGQLSYRIPYTTAFKTVGSSNGQQTNISIQLSQQYGKRLKRILHTVWNPQEKWNTAYDSANYDGEKILSYQTFMDSMPIQDRILSCLRPSGRSINEDDWLENKKFLDKRSSIVSKEHYAINWFHIDQFFEPHDREHGALPEVNLDEGIAMDTAKQWLFSGLVNAAASASGLIHYTYAEFARDILITNAGPVFV